MFVAPEGVIIEVGARQSTEAIEDYVKSGSALDVNGSKIASSAAPIKICYQLPQDRSAADATEEDWGKLEWFRIEDAAAYDWNSARFVR